MEADDVTARQVVEAMLGVGVLVLVVLCVVLGVVGVPIMYTFEGLFVLVIGGVLYGEGVGRLVRERRRADHTSVAATRSARPLVAASRHRRGVNAGQERQHVFRTVGRTTPFPWWVTGPVAALLIGGGIAGGVAEAVVLGMSMAPPALANWAVRGEHDRRSAGFLGTAP